MAFYYGEDPYDIEEEDSEALMREAEYLEAAEAAEATYELELQRLEEEWG